MHEENELNMSQNSMNDHCHTASSKETVKDLEKMLVENIKKFRKKLSFLHTNCEKFQFLFHSLKHLKSDNSKSRKYCRNNLYFCSKISLLFNSFESLTTEIISSQTLNV